jgi:hypothetical protein
MWQQALTQAALAEGFFSSSALCIFSSIGKSAEAYLPGRNGPTIVARFWAYGGKNGTQILFLGIGIILAAAGCVLIVAQ